ncbi:hypothetical protein JTB14_027508 [Gonioctena quinquepunctata]|nr:hypothetical protein JTB14_027508 [Gonioctena quinquepunctata]
MVWYADSGASQHMCCNKNQFIELEYLQQPSSINIGDGSTIEATGMGITVTCTDSVNKEDSQSNGEDEHISEKRILRRRDRKKSPERLGENEYSFYGVVEPKSYSDAVEGPEESKWKVWKRT